MGTGIRDCGRNTSALHCHESETSPRRFSRWGRRCVHIPPEGGPPAVVGEASTGGNYGSFASAVLGASHVGKSTLVDQLRHIAAGADAPKPSADTRIVGFDYLGERWRAIDAPGSIELLQDGIDALMAADAAVVVVSPDPDQAALAAPYLRAVEAAGVPAILFVNRMDEATARVRDIVAALQDFAGHPLVLRQVPIRENDAIVGAVDLISERAWKYQENRPSALIEIPDGVFDREQEARAGLLEDLSAFDDWLLEEIIEDREPADGPLYALCSRVLAANEAIPVLIGSASHGNGVVRLMKALRHEAPTPEATRKRPRRGRRPRQRRRAEGRRLQGRLASPCRQNRLFSRLRRRRRGRRDDRRRRDRHGRRPVGREACADRHGRTRRRRGSRRNRII